MVNQYIGQTAICSSEYIDYLLGEGVVANAGHIRLEDPKYEEEVTDKLKEVLKISTIQSKAEVVANTNKQLKSMNTIIFFMMFGASILAVAVIYNITNINIFERRREIATLSVLGFTEGELKRLVFNENFFISSFGIVLGMPLGSYFAWLAIDSQSQRQLQNDRVGKSVQLSDRSAYGDALYRGG